MSTVFYPSALLLIVLHNANNDILESYYIYHQPRCEHRKSGGATVITASATFMMRTTTIWSCTFYQYNLFSMRTPTFRTIICTFNAQYDPNFNDWGPEKVIHFHLYYDSFSFLVYDLLLQSQCHCCLIRFGCNFAKTNATYQNSSKSTVKQYFTVLIYNLPTSSLGGLLHT